MQGADVILVGAGPVGLACALSRAGAGHRVTVFERQGRVQRAEQTDDGCEVVPTHVPRAVLEQLGGWPELPAYERTHRLTTRPLFVPSLPCTAAIRYLRIC